MKERERETEREREELVGPGVGRGGRLACGMYSAFEGGPGWGVSTHRNLHVAQ